MSVIFWAIALYILYKFIFGFVIPVISATASVHAKMKNMRQQQEKFQQPSQKASVKKEQKPAPPREDYIEFEEIKE